MFRSITRLAVVLLSILAISCQKEVSVELGQGGVTTSATGSFKMKIDGTQWTAIRGVNASLLGGFINISGISADAKALSLTLNDTVPGTYVLDQASFNGAALSDSLDLAGLSYTTDQGVDTSKAGGVVTVATIDKVNKTISGTFHFKLYRDYDSKQKVITEGVFDKIPFSTTLPPAAATDTFYVKIDNSNWVAKSISGTISGADIYLTGSELDVSKLVALSIPATITPGSYTLDALAGKYIGLYSPTGTSFMTSQTGTLTILENNSSTKRIRGNFNFTAIDLLTAKSSQLTAGYFSLVYQ